MPRTAPPRPSTPAVLAALAGLAALLALSPGAAAADHHVHMQSLAYSPKDLVVHRGDTVTWDNHDAAPHNVVWESGPIGEVGDLNQNQAATREVPSSASPGKHRYRCTYHSADFASGMVGTVDIRNIAPALAITAPAAGSAVAGPFTLTGTASDADGTLVERKVLLGPDEFNFNVGADGTWSVDLPAQPHGPFSVKARVKDNDGAVAERTLALDANAPPVASFVVSPASPTSADTVRLNSTSTDDHLIATHAWDFGDGATSIATNATHRFAKGTWNVRLNVTDDHGLAGSTTQALVVRNSAPLAQFRVEPAEPAVGENATFRDLTDDIDRDAVNWTWDFGDGAKAFVRNATHAYAAPGTYSVRLSVRDADGAWGNLTKAVEVVQFAGQRPVANLTANKARGQAPLAVTFTVSGHDPDGTVASWSIDFGDGSPVLTGPGSLLEQPGHPVGHTYRRNGTFEVVFTAVDAVGAPGTNRTTIVVDPPPNRPPVVRFEVAPTASPRKGQAVVFNDASTDPDAGDQPVAWAWDFGDGARSCCDQRTVTHAYLRPGSYVTALTVTDTRNATATVTLVLEVRGEVPRVLLAVNATAGRAPLPAGFTLDARDNDGRIASWSLDWGDGSTPRRGTGPPPNATQHHVYDNPGTFIASLEAVDDDGLVGASSVTLTVGPRPPPVLTLPAGAIGATPTGQRLTYRFVATTALQGDLTYQWAFGDGRTAAGREVTYSYASPGPYTVVLTVVGAEGPVARGTHALDVAGESAGGQQRIRSEVASGVVRVAWVPDARAAGYQVWRSEDGGRFEEVAVVTGAQHYDDLDIRDGVAYAYQVTFFDPDNDGRLDRLSQLTSTEAFRRLGEVRLTGLVDSDGDGVGDTRDAYPQDASRSVAEPGLLGPLLLLGAVGVAGFAGWRYRHRVLGAVAGARSGALTRIPGLLPEQAVLLQGAGVQDVAALARSDPHDLARRTVFPLHQVEPWVFAAQFLELPGVSGSEAAALARAGVRGPMDLARTNPAFLAERTGAPLPKAERWVRAARAAAAAPA